MKRLITGALALVLFGPMLGAQDEKDKPKSQAAEKLRALVADFNQLRGDTGKAYRDAKTKEEKEKIVEGYRTKTSALAGQLLGLAQTYPNDPATVEALLMAMGIGMQADKDKAQTMLRGIVEKGTDKTVQAHAAFGLAQHLHQQLDDADPKLEATKKLTKEAEDLFDRAVKQLAGATDAKSKQVLKAAEKGLFELRNLTIGKVAPDIEGVDSDGKKFKLSDYKGKVVVLDFWAEW